jgi:hypothetical protein
MTTYGGVEIQRQAIFISVLYMDESSASWPGRFTPGVKHPLTSIIMETGWNQGLVWYGEKNNL